MDVFFILYSDFIPFVMSLEKSHDSGRTISEWVLWAQNEGFEDIIEWHEGDGASQLYYKLCVIIIFF